MMMIHMNPYLACQLSVFTRMNLYGVFMRWEVEGNTKRCKEF
jgi:hypothetical protein